MNTATIAKIGAAAGIAYLFRTTLLNQWYALTGTTTATATTATATTATATQVPPTGGTRSLMLAAAAPATTLNLDQWSYYYQQVSGAIITPAQMGQIIAAAGVDRQTPVGIEAFIAAGKTSGVFPSGLAGLPRLVPVSADLVRAAAYKPQTARLLGDRIYLPAEAWAQLRRAQTGEPSRIQSPGRAITAREYHTLRARPRGGSAA